MPIFRVADRPSGLRTSTFNAPSADGKLLPKGDAMTINSKRVALVALAVLASGAVSQARDYGQYGNVPRGIKAWIENLTDHRGIPCCATADGTVPDVWEMGASHYRVKIYGEWLDVPDAAVIKAPNRLGHAVVWIDSSEDVMGVRCFLPGPQT
jgi:hypothetical protein